MSKQTKKKTSSKKKAPAPNPKVKRAGRYFRGLLGLSACAALLFAGGSIYIRSLVLERMQSRSLSTSSLVLSRPLELFIGARRSPAELQTYLRKLGYREMSGELNEPGSYKQSNAELTVFLRQTLLPSGEVQQAYPLRINFSEGAVSQLSHAKLQTAVGNAWIEPEVLSILGNTETRASIPLSLSQYPPQLIQAILAIEDERFESHWGVDPRAVLRALYQNIRSGSVVQGGSTITQQLAKNLFLSSERSLSRKVKEAAAALFLETAYSKDQILEMYMNEVFLGQEGRIALHGFGEAARAFFNKDASDLSLAESATLAGIIKAPSAYSPRRYPEKAAARRLTVLEKMEELSYISEAERFSASQAKLIIQPAKRSRRFAPYFVDYVRTRLEELSSEARRSSGPVHVLTGLDRAYQNCAQQAVEWGLERIEKNYPALKSKSKSAKQQLQAALVSVSSISGEIRAWVGGRNYQASQFDRISQAKRQPGSAFKPFVYLAALDGNLNSYRTARVSSTLADEPLRIDIPGSGTWEPKNYKDEFSGDVTLREALAKSLNVPTVYLIQKIGTETAARAAERLGIPGPLPRVPSIALGSADLTPLELTTGYASIASGGRRRTPMAITTLVDAEKQEVTWSQSIDDTVVADEAAVFVLTNILQSAVESGTGRIVRTLGYEGPVAGKTGTTSASRDAWFVGYTPSLLTTVWVGFDDNRETKLTGSSAAAPIWTEYMKCVAPLEPELDFIPPANVVFRDIDLRTGLLATEYCPKQDVVTEVYVAGTDPVTPCSVHSHDPMDSWTARDRRREPSPRRRRPPERRERSFWDAFWR